MRNSALGAKRDIWFTTALFREFVTWADMPRAGGKTGIHHVESGGHESGPVVGYPQGVPSPRMSTWCTTSTNIHLVYDIHLGYTGATGYTSTISTMWTS